MRFSSLSALALALAAGACYTTTEQLAESEAAAAFDEDTTPAAGAAGNDIEPPGPAASGDVAPNPEEPGVPAPKKISGDPETAMRESFAAGGMESLPVLDEALSTNPGQLAPLMRGAFAGVGNDTAKCEEILLYLTVRHGHLARELSDTAAEINPEIQSWAQ